MSDPVRLDVKICGVCDPRDAEIAVAAGATHVGVIRVPGSLRARPVGVVRRVCAAAQGARRVGVYLDASTGAILREAESIGLDVIQLHGDEAPERIESLRRHGYEVWKVVKPVDADGLGEAALRYAGADLLLVEGRSDRGPGGVGARFPWGAMAEGRGRLPEGMRLGVAGGLTPENVAEAVRTLRPALVDVSSGVERAACEKDPDRIRAFVSAARGA